MQNYTFLFKYCPSYTIFFRIFYKTTYLNQFFMIIQSRNHRKRLHYGNKGSLYHDTAKQATETAVRRAPDTTV